MSSYKILGLSFCFLLFTSSQASSILEEGLSFVRRGLNQDAVSVATPTATVPIVTPTTSPPPPPPPSIAFAPPPPVRFAAPPPTSVTNRALLYNRPIQLAPGEYLVYLPSNTFNVIGAPPSINVPNVDNVFNVPNNPARSLDPAAATVFTSLGPAISQVPKPEQQSFVNLLTPDIKSLPAVSQAIQQNGLQAAPQQSTSSGSSGSSSAGASNYKIALSLIALFVSAFIILF